MENNYTKLVGNLGDYNTVGTSKSGQKYFFGKIKIGTENNTSYIEIRAYGKQAELLDDYSKTSEKITIEGHLISVKDKKVSELMNINYYVNAIVVDDVYSEFPSLKNDDEEVHYNDIEFTKSDDDLPY